MAPGRLALLAGPRPVLREMQQELAHFAVHHRDGSVLWCDGDHGFDPYHFAERNLIRGHAADDGANRVLVRRCMTAFQWDSVLSQHLAAKLHESEASLVVVAPYDRLFVHEELQDWESEDYVAYSLPHLRGLARRHQVPILLFVDMQRWWRTHPVLARMTYEAVDDAWSVTAPAGRLRAQRDHDGAVVDPFLHRGTTLLDFMEAGREVLPALDAAESGRVLPRPSPSPPQPQVAVPPMAR